MDPTNTGDVSEACEEVYEVLSLPAAVHTRSFSDPVKCEGSVTNPRRLAISRRDSGRISSDEGRRMWDARLTLQRKKRGRE